MAWDDGLATFDVHSLPSFWPEQAESAPTRNQTIGLDGDRAHRRRAQKRQMLHLLHVANAAKALERLPEPGESVHVVMAGNFNAWDLVPAVLRLANPATIRHLWVATLSFNRSNTEELVQLLDVGQIGGVTFITSCYSRSVDHEVYNHLHAALTSRGQRLAAVRSHAKLILFEMGSGEVYVIESSANLRSCRNVEQFVMTHDAELLAFHRAWMEELIQGVAP